MLLINSRMLRTRSGGANSYAVAIYLAISDDTCDKSHMAALAQHVKLYGSVRPQRAVETKLFP